MCYYLNVHFQGQRINRVCVVRCLFFASPSTKSVETANLENTNCVTLLLVAERKQLNICCMFKAVIYLTLNLIGVYTINVNSLFFESIMHIDRVNNLRT